MSSKKSSYLSQMYNSEAAPEKVNQVSSQLLNEINQDLNDHFESQEQQKQEYSQEVDSDRHHSCLYIPPMIKVILTNSKILIQI